MDVSLRRTCCTLWQQSVNVVVLVGGCWSSTWMVVVVVVVVVTTMLLCRLSPVRGCRIRERTGKALDLVGAGVLKVLWSYGRDLSRLVVGGFGNRLGKIGSLALWGKGVLGRKKRQRRPWGVGGGEPRSF